MFHSLPRMDLPFPEMPPPDLLLLSLSTAAWIAALTAGIGLWRLVSGHHRSKPHVSILTPLTPSTTIPPTPTPVGPTIASTGPTLLAGAPAPSPISGCHVEGGVMGSPRSRFTVSFSCAECHVDESGDGEEEAAAGAGGGEVTWEATGPRWMGVRGDLGWYRYQDRTAIDGSVVRLWGLKGGSTAGKRLRAI